MQTAGHDSLDLPEAAQHDKRRPSLAGDSHHGGVCEAWASELSPSNLNIGMDQQVPSSHPSRSKSCVDDHSAAHRPLSQQPPDQNMSPTIYTATTFGLGMISSAGGAAPSSGGGAPLSDGDLYQLDCATGAYSVGSPSGLSHSGLSLVGSPSATSNLQDTFTKKLNQLYARHKQRTGVFIIGVAGGTASGKTTVCDRIYQRLHDDSAVSMLSQDSFYRPLTESEKKEAGANSFNFDHPTAFDEEAIVDALQRLKAGRPVDIPVYDFQTHSRTKEKRRVEPADVVIIEGILVLHMPAIRDLLNMKLYVDTDDDVRLARRIQRDVAERGRDIGGVIDQYTRFVKPAFDMFVAPSRKHADIVIPWGGSGSNIVAIDLITEHIRGKLGQHALRRVYPNLVVVPSTYQSRGMHTILRDTTTSRQEFVFYADRLIRLVVEAGLGHLPFEEKIVTTPTGSQYVGVTFWKSLCGVSIIRSGEAMENALRACCQGIKIGKILVLRHTAAASDSELIYQRLPADIAERHVMLMDAVLSTGNTACKAIKTLLGKGVHEDRILFLSIIAAPEGLQKVCSCYPAVKVITSEIDERLGPDFRVLPGLGDFGDRYFSD